MRLKEWDDTAAEHGAYIEREYPDEIIADFVSWFRLTRQWRESPEMCYDKWRRFELKLAEHRQQTVEKAAQERAKRPEGLCAATTKAGEPCKGRAVQDGLCIAHVKVRQAA